MFIDKILELKCGKKKKERQKTRLAVTLKQDEKTSECFFKIIVPNYNNMPYVKKCLDSILS